MKVGLFGYLQTEDICPKHKILNHKGKKSVFIGIEGDIEINGNNGYGFMLKF